jgi:hypothetical protein
MRVILFLINGQLVVLPGWEPRPQPSLAICERRADFAREYLATLDTPSFVVYCGPMP